MLKVVAEISVSVDSLNLLRVFQASWWPLRVERQAIRCYIHLLRDKCNYTGRNFSWVEKKGPQEPDGAKLNHEPEAIVVTTSASNVPKVNVIEMKMTRQLLDVGLSVESAISCGLFVREKIDRHEPQPPCIILETQSLPETDVLPHATSGVRKSCQKWEKRASKDLRVNRSQVILVSRIGSEEPHVIGRYRTIRDSTHILLKVIRLISSVWLSTQSYIGR